MTKVSGRTELVWDKNTARKEMAALLAGVESLSDREAEHLLARETREET